MKKEKDHAFGKDVYLLGVDEFNDRYWLEAPSWDCEWYWGFGYVETYEENRKPSQAIDINSHQHIESNFLGKNNAKDRGYCHNIFDSKLLDKATFTEDEGWELSELFRQFYLLKSGAELFKNGTSGTANIKIETGAKRLKWQKTINEEILPKIFKQIIKILSPKKIIKAS